MFKKCWHCNIRAYSHDIDLHCCYPSMLLVSISFTVQKYGTDQLRVDQITEINSTEIFFEMLSFYLDVRFLKFFLQFFLLRLMVCLPNRVLKEKKPHATQNTQHICFTSCPNLKSLERDCSVRRN